MISFDLNLFQTLKALYEEGSATLVARRFGITQAAVSAQLAKLRQHYKDDLFHSTGRGMEPTPLMHRLIMPISELIELAGNAASLKSDFDPLVHERRFSILAGSGYAMTLLAEVSRKLHAEAPGVYITLSTFPSLDTRSLRLTDLLNKHRCDFAVIVEEMKSPSHPTIELYSDDYVCLVDKDNPLLGDVIDGDQYYSLTHVVRQTEELSGLHEIVSLGDGPRKKKIGPVVRTNALVPFFLIGTHYIATVPRHFALGAAMRLPLRLVELQTKAPKHRIMLQWASHLEHEPGAIWLRDKIQQVASELLNHESN